jgi:hypothetical protein
MSSRNIDALVEAIGSGQLLKMYEPEGQGG